VLNKDRTAGIEPRCDFPTVPPLLGQVNAIATASGGSWVFSLTQQPAIAAYGIFCGLQVTELDNFFALFSVILSFFLIGVAFREVSC
jgi:hypothetical protein